MRGIACRLIPWLASVARKRQPAWPTGLFVMTSPSWSLCPDHERDSIEACTIPKHDRGAITLPCAAASAPRSMGQFALVPLAQGRTLSNGLPVGLARSRTASRLLPAEHAIGGRSRRTKASKQKNPLIPAFSPGRQSLGIRNDWADACHLRFQRACDRSTILSFPKIPSGLDSHRKAESSHH